MKPRTIFWSSREHRLRAAWRILVQLAIAGLLILPLIFAAGQIEGLRSRKEWVADLSPAMFDKLMDFTVGPLFMVAIVSAVILAARFVDRRDWRDLGLQLNHLWWSDFVFGIVLGALLIGFVYVAEESLNWVEISPRKGVGVAGVPMAVLWAFVAVKAVCIGMQEEVLTRGYWLKNVAEGLNGAFRLAASAAATAAAILTSLVFAALHFATDNASAQSFAGLALNGMLFAVPVLLTGRLATPIGLHMSWNFAQGGIFGYPVSGDVENVSLLTATATGPVGWTGGAYGPEAGYLGYLAMVLGICAIAVRVRLTTGGAAIRDELAEYRARF